MFEITCLKKCKLENDILFTTNDLNDSKGKNFPGYFCTVSLFNRNWHALQLCYLEKQSLEKIVIKNVWTTLFWYSDFYLSFAFLKESNYCFKYFKELEENTQEKSLHVLFLLVHTNLGLKYASKSPFQKPKRTYVYVIRKRVGYSYCDDK
jgi:hypothetical protein